ncbi:MAG: low specificity L-threonine aldolase [Spirochaetales bacterium]|nr:low specificity L-threonine aldolase [Spirochaetales bacterium]
MGLNKIQFASDNYSGICPQAVQSMIEANRDFSLAYGEDSYTQKVCDLFRKIFETDCEIFFVFNGTAANALALASLCQSYHSIICHETAHIETNECGAPEFASNGSKILLAKGQNGKLDAGEVEKIITRRSDIHYPKPKVISLTQATELGTVYTPGELQAIRDVACKYDLKLHMDGARFANALVFLNLTPAELTWKAGIDVLCLGGVKNGLAVGEAVVFFNKDQARDFAYRCKQAGQLASKMRYLSTPWLGLLGHDVWKKNAAHANKMARYLKTELDKINGVKIKFPVEANAVFADMPDSVVSGLRAAGWRFYNFIGVGGARLMCSWATTKQSIDFFLKDVKKHLD